MKKQPRELMGLQKTVIRPPAYPFTGRQLFRNLRQRLSAEFKDPMGYERLGQIMGKPKSMAHYWFDTFNHPHVLAFMCCLERLSMDERHDFIDTHCRIVPSLEHPCIAHSPANVGILLELLNQKSGLSIITGGTEASREFLLSALAHHAYSRASTKGGRPAGIDLHLSDKFVPVESLTYIARSAGPKQVQRAVQNLWPRILTSHGRLVVCNGVWSAVPEVRDGLLRCARNNHVLLAEAGTPDLDYVKAMVLTPIHVIALSNSKLHLGGIRIVCRRVKPLKSLKKRRLR